jgi:hypothetical protein
MSSHTALVLPIVLAASMVSLPARPQTKAPLHATPQTKAPLPAWPKPTRTMHPWTRWWWPGSAVDRANIDRLLRAYRAAGLGGVEITPIYGVDGMKSREVRYLTPAWLDLLRFTIDRAASLDMGVDMPDGTGWPFGGSTVSKEELADSYRIHIIPWSDFPLSVYPVGEIQALTAVSSSGETLNLLDRIQPDGNIRGPRPQGDWRLYTLESARTDMRVKRAAPGGGGLCIDPFSKESVSGYLHHFDSALDSLPRGGLRAHFCDSFEYTAGWTRDLLAEFKRRRGYDLADHLPAFTRHASNDEIRRVRADYCETISDLLFDRFARYWTDWAHGHGSLSRYQAHGSPGNLLDLYAAADIPETETYGGVGDPRLNKFASSAAHVAGRRLCSSESCTWLGEHFQITLAKMRATLDRLFVSGINHIFYHGTDYSPSDAAWPGWLFYASTDVEPDQAIWRDLPALNAYATRCQSILQSGEPDNDILLYWPLHDLWQRRDVFGLTIEGDWLKLEPIGTTAQLLWNRGYAFDYVSDRQLQAANVEHDRIAMPGGRYRAIVVPPCDYMPETTLRRLLELARAGATVVFQKSVPGDVPGLYDLQRRRAQLTWDRLQFDTLVRAVRDRSSRPERQRVFIGEDLPAMLAAAHIRREPVADRHGAMLIRRRRPDGHDYFIANQGADPIDGWVDLADPALSAAIMDPMTGRIGVAALRGAPDHASVALQIAPGESVIVRTYDDRMVAGARWRYVQTAGEPAPLDGPWHVEFIEGGPVLPKPFDTTALGSWTQSGDPDAERFAGTARYRLAFDAPASTARSWLLDLGDVRESCRVRLNGKSLGTLIGPPYRVYAGTLKPAGNLLEVKVTNLSANRIRDLDRRGVRWRIFRDINFVDKDYRPFNATHWSVRDSGLLGPVHLIPVTAQPPEPSGGM